MQGIFFSLAEIRRKLLKKNVVFTSHKRSHFPLSSHCQKIYRLSRLVKVLFKRPI